MLRGDRGAAGRALRALFGEERLKVHTDPQKGFVVEGQLALELGTGNSTYRGQDSNLHVREDGGS